MNILDFLKHNKKMIVHAWLRCGSFCVTGGTGEGYAMVAKFKMFAPWLLFIVAISEEKEMKEIE